MDWYVNRLESRRPRLHECEARKARAIRDARSLTPLKYAALQARIPALQSGGDHRLWKNNFE